jgi:glutathione S-transferase
MFFYNASFEPALIDKSMKREPGAAGDLALRRLRHGDEDAAGPARRRPVLLGERFTAVDVLWGTALRWTTMFKLVPETPAITAYIERVASRPAAQRAAKIDARSSPLARSSRPIAGVPGGATAVCVVL